MQKVIRKKLYYHNYHTLSIPLGYLQDTQVFPFKVHLLFLLDISRVRRFRQIRSTLPESTRPADYLRPGLEGCGQIFERTNFLPVLIIYTEP